MTMKQRKKPWLFLLIGLWLITALTGCLPAALLDGPTGVTTRSAAVTTTAASAELDEVSAYTAPEEVAAYLHAYGKLPGNYITKRQAGELGWDASRGNLWEVTDRMSIGGDRFGNREGLLPDKEGRVWYECDVNYNGGYRGAERLVYSNDGLIYYTNDHYQSFTRLY
ncbi:MAG: ribonuclease domain-containing protein [Eubacteriales bacterium]|nr:ribonuclease domain-containing protein [Eubacteriales bacterium]